MAIKSREHVLTLSFFTSEINLIVTVLICDLQDDYEEDGFAINCLRDHWS